MKENDVKLKEKQNSVKVAKICKNCKSAKKVPKNCKFAKKISQKRLENIAHELHACMHLLAL